MLRYGMNPHQAARLGSDTGSVRVLAGEPSLINWLDLLNAWMLVREARAALGRQAGGCVVQARIAGRSCCRWAD